MAVDEHLAARVRAAVATEPATGAGGVTERRMFGGLAFLVDGRMAVAAGSEGALLLRVDPAEAPALLDEPLVRRVEMRGRPMQGWLRIDAAAVEAEEDLRAWVHRGLARVRALPPG